MPLADLIPAPVVGGGDPGRVPLDEPLVGLAVAVALAYVQPEKFTKTLSFGLAALEQSHEKVAVVVLAVPLPGAESVGKAVMVAVELEMEAVPELAPEPEAEEDDELLEAVGKGWFLVVRVVGTTEDDSEAIVSVVGGVWRGETRDLVERMWDGWIG